MTGSVPVYVINLDRSQRRLRHMQELLAREGLAFERVRGIDGRDPAARDVAGVDETRTPWRYHFMPLTREEVACALSHRLAWRTFLDTSDAPFALFLEDDADFTAPVTPVLEALARDDAPRGWDMIKLYNKRRRAASRPCGELATGARLVRPLVMPIRSVAEIISREGARKLIAATQTLERPIDTALQYWWELGLDIRVIDPPMVEEVSGHLGGSDIRRWPGGRTWRKMRRELLRPVYQGKLLALSLRHFADPPGGRAFRR